VPTEVTPEPEPPAASPEVLHKAETESYTSVMLEPAGSEMLAPVPVVMRLAAIEPESLLFITAACEAALIKVR
jgi:hypothetical protein